jgi:hypothetical protein
VPAGSSNCIMRNFKVFVPQIIFTVMKSSRMRQEEQVAPEEEKKCI